MAGLAATIVLQADVWLASATFLAFAAVGVFVIVRSALLGARCNLARYNRASLGGMSEEQIEAMGDDGLAERARRAKRERGTYAAVMLAATAVGLVLMFTPASRLFLLAWPWRPRVPCDQGVPFRAKRRLGVTRGSSKERLRIEACQIARPFDTSDTPLATNRFDQGEARPWRAIPKIGSKEST